MPVSHAKHQRPCQLAQRDEYRDSRIARPGRAPAPPMRESADVESSCLHASRTGLADLTSDYDHGLANDSEHGPAVATLV